MKYKSLILLFIGGCWMHPSFAQELDDYQRCLVETLADADSRMAVGDIREACREKHPGMPAENDQAAASTSAVARRMIQEKITEDKAFVLTPYRPNYILLAAYNAAGVNEQPFQEAFPDKKPDLNDTEVKFQISFKFPIVKNLFGDNGDLYAAYTNRSFWQVYNTDSAPFRETNHEPEAWLRVTTHPYQHRAVPKRPFEWRPADCIPVLAWSAGNWRCGNRPRRTFLSGSTPTPSV